MIFVPRTGEEILRLFNGRPLVDPGLVLVSRWRPDAGGLGHNADRAWAYGGVAVTRCTKRSSAAPNSRPIRRSSAGKTVPVNAVRFARTSAKGHVH